MWNGLCLHFSIQHWAYSISIPEEHPNPLPKFECCRSQVQTGRLNTQHYASNKCKQGEERRIRRETLQHFFEAGRASFHINTEALPPSEAFPYLGRIIAYNNSDWLVLYQNLRKYCRQWVMVARAMERAGATVRSQVLMYKLLAQSVIFYGKESWVVTGDMFKVLDGFHHQVAWRITGLVAKRRVGGEW